MLTLILLCYARYLVVFIFELLTTKNTIMKMLKTSLIALGMIFSMQSFASEKNLKPINKNQTEQVTIDLAQFGKYLMEDYSKTAEGVYRTEDKRYTIAIIKNEENSHDYIGVIISSDNAYWNSGEIRFNFVLESDNKLVGYYYDSKGDEHRVSFQVGEDGVVSNLFEKVSVEELRNSGIALLK